MTTDNNPFADIDTIADRLEDGIETITGQRPRPSEAMTRDMRGGAAAGMLIAAAINAYYALIVGDPNRTGPAVELHHSLVSALETCAGDMRVEVAQTLINVLAAWLNGTNMRGHIGDQASAAIDHLETAYNHIAAGADTDGETHPMHAHSHGDDGEPFAPRSVPDGAVERLGEAASALGISPIINVEGDGGTDHTHPVVPAAVLSGLVTGRATMEFIDMMQSAPEELQAAGAPLWVTGFSRGATAGYEEPDDDMVAAAALLLVNITGMWHKQREGTRFGLAIAALCSAANHAGRADGLARSVETRAEYVAHYGSDENDAARKALEAAEAAVEYLKDTADKV